MLSKLAGSSTLNASSGTPVGSHANLMSLSKRLRPLQMLVATVAVAGAVTTAAQLPSGGNLPNPTHAGYLDVEKNAGSKIYYQYYEADSECVALLGRPPCTQSASSKQARVITPSPAACPGPYPDDKKAPIILWLQVRPAHAAMQAALQGWDVLH